MLSSFKKRVYSLMATLAVAALMSVSAFASETPTYDADWVVTQMQTGLQTASGNIIHAIGVALLGGLAVFGIVVGVRVALRIFGAVSRGRG